MAINEVSIDISSYANIPKTSEDFQMAGFSAINPATGVKQKYSDSEMRKLHNMLNRWNSDGLDKARILDNFNRFYSVFPETEMPQDLKTYIFVTRPEMNLFADTGPSSELNKDNINDSRLQYMYAMNPEILHMLTDAYSNIHKFIPYLQSRAESLQLPDYQIRTSEMTVPFYNYKYAYPTVTNESITGGTFDVVFREDEELRITKMMQFWIYYQDAVMKNKLKPSKAHIYDSSYDFMCSVFEIVCDPTSERILFWAKYSGCFPTSVPLSNLSFNRTGNVDNKVSISFNYTMVEAMTPEVIRDFMTATPYAGTKYIPVYDASYGMNGASIVGCPVIIKTTDQHGLLLKWTEMLTGRTSVIPDSIPTLDNFVIKSDRATTFRQQTIPSTKYTYRGKGQTAQSGAVPDTGYKYRGLNTHLIRNSDKV